MEGLVPAQHVPRADRRSYTEKSYQGLDWKTAQEQALSIKSIEAGVYHTRQDPRCRLCKVFPETFQHVIAGFKMLAGGAYKEDHNQVAGIV